MAVSWLAMLALSAIALGAPLARASPLPANANLEELHELDRMLYNDLKDDSERTDIVFTNNQATSEDLEPCGRVWVTINSLNWDLGEGLSLLDPVELNWDFEGCARVPQQIGLFAKKPDHWNDSLVRYEIPLAQGFIVTNFTLGKVDLPGGWEDAPGMKGSHCLWPWVRAGDDKNAVSNCLKIQPNWMEDSANKINSFRISEIAIPGTHNAGSWRFNTEIMNVERDMFVLCQDRSIWAQMVFGIRYFDFRVGYYDFFAEEEDRYWLNHNLIRVRPLVPLLREIRYFLASTKEVIFLDIHHLPVGFYAADGKINNKAHYGLLKVLQQELGAHLAMAYDFSAAGLKGPTMEVLIKANTRLVLSYVDRNIVKDNAWLWPNVRHLWANTNNPNELFKYLDNALTTSPNSDAQSPLHSAMAQTTPNVLDILFLRGSLRENADAVNRNITKRLQTTWKHNVNIISPDFFLGTDVVDLSININTERHLKNSLL